MMTPLPTAKQNTSGQGFFYELQNGNTYLESLWAKGIYPKTTLCTMLGCFRKHSAGGLCESHRWQMRKAKEWERKANDTRYIAWRKVVDSRKAEKLLRGTVGPTKRRKERDPVESRYKMAIYECAKRKNKHFKWSIGLEDFRWLCAQPCWYCGGELGSVKFGKGLDRIDSSKDYTMENVYPCCNTCNRIKGHDLTAREAKQIIQGLLLIRRIGDPK